MNKETKIEQPKIGSLYIVGIDGADDTSSRESKGGLDEYAKNEVMKAIAKFKASFEEAVIVE